MLRGHAEVREVAPVLLEEGALAAGDDVDDVARVGGEELEGFARVVGGDGHVWDFDDRRECAL